MRQSVVFALVVGLLLLLFGSSMASSQAQAGVQVKITAPTDGFITFSPKLRVQGTTQAPAGAKLDLVVVSVNGKAQRANLKADGSFGADVELEYFGQNVVSATAITDNKQIGSARALVNLQRRVLFFDDFNNRDLKPNWRAASGNWTLAVREEGNRVFTITESKEHNTKLTFLKDGLDWKDYAVEVDILNSYGWDKHDHWGPRFPQILFVVVRARDALNMVAFHIRANAVEPDDAPPIVGGTCWRLVRNGQWSDCINWVEPAPPANFRLRIEVQGNLFTAYVNGIKVSSWLDREGEYTQGMPGLGIWHKFDGAFDNFKVESLEPRLQSAMAAELEVPPTPDWELIKTQLAQLSPQLQDLDSRINTLQVAVGSVSKNLPEAQASVTPEDLNAISQRLDSLEQLLQAQGQSKEIESLKAALGEQIIQIKRMSDAVDRMTEEFGPLQKRVESAATKAESVESKATLGLIVGAAGGH